MIPCRFAFSTIIIDHNITYIFLLTPFRCIWTNDDTLRPIQYPVLTALMASGSTTVYLLLVGVWLGGWRLIHCTNYTTRMINFSDACLVSLGLLGAHRLSITIFSTEFTFVCIWQATFTYLTDFDSYQALTATVIFTYFAPRRRRNPHKMRFGFYPENGKILLDRWK